MINHLRTLLLNEAGSTADSSIPGEEYIPATFTAARLPAALERARSALFGPNADRALKNLRLRQLLYPLHAGELAPYATDLDPRITYWPPRSDNLFRGFVFGAAASLIAGEARPVTLLGSFNDFASPDNVIFRRWRVTVDDGTNVTVRGLKPATDDTTTAYTLTDGLSNLIPLYGTQLGLRFGSGSTDYPIWEVSALLQPARGLPEVLSDLRALGSPTEIFPGDGSEPYRTLRTIWESSVPDVLALSAFVLALGYRIDEFRRQMG